MVDLREFSGYLMGMKIKPRHQKGGHTAYDDYIISKRTYVVEEVYPYYVRYREVVNEDREYIDRACFNVGDLVQMGIIHSVGQRESSLQAKGIRDRGVSDGGH